MAEIDNSLGQNSGGLPDLALVAYTGEYSDLLNSPTLLSQFTNDVGFLTSVPNLEQVTTIGNTTDKGVILTTGTERIEIGTIDVGSSIIFYDSAIGVDVLAGMSSTQIYLQNSISASPGQVSFFQDGQILLYPTNIQITGYSGDFDDIVLSNKKINFTSGSNQLRFTTNFTSPGITDLVFRTLGNSTQTVAYLSDITGATSTLQEVTDVGNITTNPITIGDLTINAASLDLVTINYDSFDEDPVIIFNNTNNGKSQGFNIPFDSDCVWFLPDISGNIALTTDITANNADALKRDGSNANSNVNLGSYNINANEVTSTNRINGDGYYLMKIGGELGLYVAGTDAIIAILDSDSGDNIFTYANGYLTYNANTNELKWGSNIIATLADIPSLTGYATTSYVDSGLGTKEPVITAGTTAQYYRGDKTFQTLNKTAVGLANVDNTSDASKPVSTAQQTALDLKLNKAKYITQGYTQLTGVNTTTVVASIRIPANTYASGESFEIIMTPNKSTTAAAIAINVYHATSVNGMTSVICSAITLSTTQRTGYIQRVLTIDGTTLRNSMPASASGITPIAGTTVGATTTFNPAVDNWITVTMNPSVVSEVVGFNNLTVRPL